MCEEEGGRLDLRKRFGSDPNRGRAKQRTNVMGMTGGTGFDKNGSTG